MDYATPHMRLDRPSTPDKRFCYDETCVHGYGYHGGRTGFCDYCGRPIQPTWTRDVAAARARAKSEIGCGHCGAPKEDPTNVLCNECGVRDITG